MLRDRRTDAYYRLHMSPQHFLPNLFKTLIGLCLLAVATACANSLQSDIETALTNPEQTGIRWGLVVAEMDGTELLSLNADSRFTPASNTKVVTTMASYHALEALSAPALNPGTRVLLEPDPDGGAPDLVLVGGGDAMLTDRVDCETSCLSDLADQVAASGLTEVGQVIGDDTFFAYERWGVGWSVEDLKFYYGTAISALSVNDNLVWVEIAPGAIEGEPAIAEWQDGDALLSLNMQIVTTAPETKRRLRVERFPGANTVRLYGEMPVDAIPVQLRLAIETPAEFAARRFARLLEAREISVAGTSTRHRSVTLSDEPPEPDDEAPTHTAVLTKATEAVAHLPASPLTDSLKRISKDSENLHADIALRRLGLLEGTGSRLQGVAALEAFLEEAGVPETGYAFHGGSGMSVYNRISPRAMVELLAFAAEQDWFEAWLADQPIGGVDGSLERRFIGTPLEGKMFAKTGTLNGANALSGMMIAASGRQLLFSIIANDRPDSTRSAIPEMDAALNLIAAAY